MKDGTDCNNARSGSNYKRKHTPEVATSSSILKSSGKAGGKQNDVLVEDFKLEETIKHVTIRATAEVLEFKRDGKGPGNLRKTQPIIRATGSAA